MEGVNMIIASHGRLWLNAFALRNLVLGQRGNYVFFYLIRPIIPSLSLSLFLTHTQDNKWLRACAAKISFDKSFNCSINTYSAMQMKPCSRWGLGQAEQPRAGHQSQSTV